MATARNWVGGKHSFFDASSWTPAGQPVAGDTATIGLGSASAPNVAVIQNRVLDHIAVRLDDGLTSATPVNIGPAETPTLALSNVIVASGTSIEAGTVFSFGPSVLAEAITVDGFVLNHGTIGEVNGYFNGLTITLGANALLLNESGGTISGADYNTLDIEGGSRSILVNDGTVSGQGTALDVGVAAYGNGVFDMTDGDGFATHFRHPSTLEFHQGVGEGQTIALNHTTLILDAPSRFLATIDDRSVSYDGGEPVGRGVPNSSVLLKGEQATDLSFQNSVLTVSNGYDVLASLAFSTDLNSANFVLANTPQGASIDISSPTFAAASTLGVSPAQSHA